MNEFERRLAQQPLRQVPPDWRREVLAHATQTGRAPRVRAAILDWLWPSPLAWASLILIWLALAAVFTVTERNEPDITFASSAAPTGAHVDAAQGDEVAASLLAYHTRPDLFADLAHTP
jgi:hypothetical protein